MDAEEEGKLKPARLREPPTLPPSLGLPIYSTSLVQAVVADIAGCYINRAYMTWDIILYDLFDDTYDSYFTAVSL